MLGNAETIQPLSNFEINTIPQADTFLKSNCVASRVIWDALAHTVLAYTVLVCHTSRPY